MQTILSVLIAGLSIPFLSQAPLLIAHSWLLPASSHALQIAQTTSTKPLSEQAKAFTVRIDGDGDGSGSIVGHTGNTYMVLTNWHVVENSGTYKVTTVDGQSYTVTKKQKLSSLDLAVVYFESSRTYATVKLGDSNNLSQGDALAISGYPSKEIAGNTKQRSHQFLSNQLISGFIQEGEIEGGYTISIQGTTLEGMSGSPIINSKAELIAIYGAASALGQLVYAIPINKVLKAAQTDKINLAQSTSISTISKVQPKQTSTAIPVPSNPLNNNFTSRKFKFFKSLTGHSDEVNSVTISPDSKLIVSASDDNTIKFWNAKTGDLVKTIYNITEDLHAKGVTSVAISPDGNILVSGNSDSTIKIWSMRTGNLIRTLNMSTFRGGTSHISISSDGQTLASAYNDYLDKKVRIWNLKKLGNLIRSISVPHILGINSIAISRDGQSLASATGRVTGGDAIKIWNLETGDLMRSFSSDAGIETLFISPDGQILVGGDYKNNIRVWNFLTGNLMQTLTGHSGIIKSLAISPNSQTLFSGSVDNNIKIWNIKTWQLVQTLTGHSDEINSVSISPDGQTLVSASKDQTIKIWQLQ